MDTWTIDHIIFKHPFTCILAGPTGAGKTVLLSKILTYKNEIIDPKPEKIIYCYKSWQSIYDTISNSLDIPIEFNQGLYNIELFDKSKNNLLIIDDLMGECENNTDIKQLFAVDSHHSNISVFLITQNIFPKGKVQEI
jgi:DNA replication protein DnaC